MAGAIKFCNLWWDNRIELNQAADHHTFSWQYPARPLTLRDFLLDLPKPDRL
jgi:hypothetical protein